jgi:hypothetical protein
MKMKSCEYDFTKNDYYRYVFIASILSSESIRRFWFGKLGFLIYGGRANIGPMDSLSVALTPDDVIFVLCLLLMG